MTARAMRVAVVGTGSRARTYTADLARRPGWAVVALCDPSPTRRAYHQRVLASAGAPPASEWDPSGFTELLAAEAADCVVVTSVDATHDRYVVAALEAGRRVVCEKPLTTTAEKCARILTAAQRPGAQLQVGFNYRFNPVHQQVRQLLAAGTIGTITSVHFEWQLDVAHGADYFRRWHRQKANSGGLLVHKSGHHFDLVNWWLGATPVEAFGYGRLAFYGRESGTRHGLRHDYQRAYGAAAAGDDPFALDLAANPELSALYLDAEADSGYIRDANVFGDGIDIEDDVTLAVRYADGASMSYHLVAYSPWEGYRVMFNGSRGRLELEVEEQPWRPASTGPDASGLVHGADEQTRSGHTVLRLRPLWQPPRELPLQTDHRAHGGGDQRMLDALFGDGPSTDVASLTDGVAALGIGLAANASLHTGRPVTVADALAATPGAPGDTPTDAAR